MSLLHRRHPGELELDDSWGTPSPGVELVDSRGRVIRDKHDAHDSGDPVWSSATGFVGGALGGVAMLATAEGVSRAQHLGVDYLEIAGAAARHFPAIGAASPALAGALLSASVGAVTGGLLAWLSRRATRVAPRLIFFVLFLPALWLLVQVFVIFPLSPSARALPAAPWLAGALVYGIFLALSPPIVRKDAPAGTAEFP